MPLDASGILVCMKWRIVTNQREVIVVFNSRAHALWGVACDKRYGEKILRIEKVP